jgi:hypothetical protein
MESISSYIPGIVKKISDTINIGRKDLDGIKFIRFEKISFKEHQDTLCVLLGYERGFEVWDIESDPVLLFSKRNQGLSMICYIPRGLSVSFALVSLYDTSDFPSNSFQIFSMLENKIEHQKKTDGNILNIQSNSMVLAVSLPTKIDLFDTKNYNKSHSVNICNNELKFTLANWYIGYSAAFKQDLAEENEIKIKDVISKTMHNIAETGINKFKNYIDSTPHNSFYGKIWIKNILHNSLVCEIQAFNSPVSTLYFSKSSHLLIVSPVSGLSFHIYRINPPKEIRGEYKNRYFLVYKLHRGLTPAEINDITISDDEKIVIVSSSRGTCHVYQINPESNSLTYNLEVYCRIKLGSFLDTLVYPKCQIVLFSKFSTNRPAPEVIMVNNLGALSRYTIDATPVLISTTSLARNKDFKEIAADVPAAVRKKKSENDIEYNDITYTGWIPLTRSPQFCFYNTRDSYSDWIGSDPELIPFDQETFMPGFTIHYDKASKLQEALDASIPLNQVIATEIDSRFLETSPPAFKIYLNDHFSK